MTGGTRLDELDDDIREHLERDVQDNLARGMTPEAAYYAARRKFGNVALVKERARAVWIPVWVDHLRQDLGYAVRMLGRYPGFSAVIILTLALGIGMNTAVFSVVNAVLLRPLSFARPERMLWLATLDAGSNDEVVGSHDVLAWRDATSLERLVAYDEFDGRVNATGITAPARIATVSDGFWELAGARPALGRLPAVGQSEVLLSQAFFEHWFGANPEVIGRTVMVGGRRAAVAGVLPPGFHVDLPQPSSVSDLAPREIEVYHGVVVRALPKGVIQLFYVVGQLKPGVSIDTARAELETIHARVQQENQFPRQTVRVVPLTEKLVGDARRRLMILLAAVVMVLLVGCANVASLLLARASARQKELAIRTAVGAGRGRMLRQLLVESLVLAIAGGSAGLLIAHGCLRVVLGLIPQAVPRLSEARLDGHVLAFTLAVSALTALLFGVGPALSLWRTNVYGVLKDGTRTVSATARGARTRTWLVTLQLALTLVLLCGAGLLVKSLWRVTAHPSGFAPAQTLTMTVDYETGGSQGTESRRRAYIAEGLRRVRTVPGVAVVGMTTNASGRLRLFIEGTPKDSLRDRPTALHSSVSEGYATAIGMRLLAGRWLTDTEPAAVFVINESLARRDFPGEDPLGRRIQIGGPLGAAPAEGATFATIVGVVADLKYGRLDRPPEPELFADYGHASPFSITFVARVDGDPLRAAPGIRELIVGMDKSQPVSEVRTVEAVLADSIAPRRFTVFLLGTFAAAALLLALIGVYGVMTYSVVLRTREIGVRMALGAARRDVLRMVLQEGLAIAMVGLALGVGTALAMTRVMTSLLYDVAPTDPATFAVVSGVLAATVLTACAGPALSAARVDPLVALRDE